MASLEKVQRADYAKESQLDAFSLVERAFDENKIQYSARRDQLRYDIPNFHLCFEKVVDIAREALQETEFYPQEMSYKEMVKEEPKRFSIDYLLILHRDDNQ